MKYEVLSNLHHDQKLYKKGDSIELVEEFAEPLLKLKVIKEVPDEDQGKKEADDQGKKEVK